jgi:hypothetical protein
MTISGIEPATSLLVSRLLNQLHHRDSCPEIYVFYLLKTESGLVVWLHILPSIAGAFLIGTETELLEWNTKLKLRETNGEVYFILVENIPLCFKIK